jgi:hypothetical protein
MSDREQAIEDSPLDVAKRHPGVGRLPDELLKLGDPFSHFDQLDLARTPRTCDAHVGLLADDGSGFSEPHHRTEAIFTHDQSRRQRGSPVAPTTTRLYDVDEPTHERRKMHRSGTGFRAENDFVAQRAHHERRRHVVAIDVATRRG